MIRSILYSILVVIALLALLIVYAASPAVSASSFPPERIIHFSRGQVSGWHTNQRPDPLIKIVTYNLGYASGDKNSRSVALTEEEVLSNLSWMVRTLKELDADILCLQEVDFQAERTLDINQLEFLAKGLGMPHGAYVVVWNKRYLPWPYWPPTAHFGRIVSGQVVLSRYPILSQETFIFKKPSANPFWYNWFYPDKAAQKLTVKIGNRNIKIWNIHLEAFRTEARMQQAKQLAKLVLQDKKRGHRLIAGDFNSVSAYRQDLPPKEIKKLEDRGETLAWVLQETGMRNAEKGLPFFSFPSWVPIKKIDHILYDPSVSLSRAGHLRLTASDHLPVWAEFKLK